MRSWIVGLLSVVVTGSSGCSENEWITSGPHQYADKLTGVKSSIWYIKGPFVVEDSIVITVGYSCTEHNPKNGPLLFVDIPPEKRMGRTTAMAIFGATKTWEGFSYDTNLNAFWHYHFDEPDTYVSNDLWMMRLLNLSSKEVQRKGRDALGDYEHLQDSVVKLYFEADSLSFRIDFLSPPRVIRFPLGRGFRKAVGVLREKCDFAKALAAYNANLDTLFAEADSIKAEEDKRIAVQIENDKRLAAERKRIQAKRREDARRLVEAREQRRKDSIANETIRRRTAVENQADFLRSIGFGTESGHGISAFAGFLVDRELETRDSAMVVQLCKEHITTTNCRDFIQRIIVDQADWLMSIDYTDHRAFAMDFAKFLINDDLTTREVAKVVEICKKNRLKGSCHAFLHQRGYFQQRGER